MLGESIKAKNMDPTSIPIRDIRYPSELDWWPFAIGWWLLIFIVVLSSLFLGYKLYKRWLNNHARRIALLELRAIQEKFNLSNDIVILVQELSILLRRTFLAYLPREKVGGLVGEHWLGFLDQGLDGKYFSEGVGRFLVLVPYQHKSESEIIDVEELLNIIKLRIETPIIEEGN
ncbi:MAG: hypothetical protein ACI8XI_000797 [Woeseiaceae bacterium]